MVGRLDRLASRLRRVRPVAAAQRDVPCIGCHEKVGRPASVVPIPGRTAAATDIVVPADVLMAAVDGQLVAQHTGSSLGVLLNASAALIFTAFDGVRPLSEIVAQLAAETGVNAALLANDVRATTDRLLAQGMVTLASDGVGVAPGAAASPPESNTEPAGPDPQRWRPAIERLLATIPWAFERRKVALVGTSCDVRADDEAVGELLAQLLASLGSVERLVEGEPSRHDVSVVSLPHGGSTSYRVVRDGRVVTRVKTAEWAVVYALHQLDLLAIDDSAGAILFHAGAVERDGRVVIVLGVSGKGKSTLTAALVRHGFRYLSDEVAAVSGTTLELLPYPKALDLDTKSLALLGLDTPDASLGSAKEKVLPNGLGEVGTGGRPALLVFLAEPLVPESAGAEAPVEPVPPAEALLALLPVTFRQTIADPDHFAAMAALCESTPAIRVGRASLPATIAAIERALAGASRRQRPDDL